MTNYSCPLVISCELISKLLAMLVSPYLDIVATNDNITALGGILLNFLCLLWPSSNYIIDTYSLYYKVCGLG